MNNKDYRYRLGKIVARCPQCRRRTFKPYIDLSTGQVLDPDCGRCNREIKCAYHLTPSDLYRQRPGAFASGWPPKALPPARQPPMSEIRRSVMDATMSAPRHLNSLYRFMTARFDRVATDRAFDALSVGTARYGGGSPVFWMVDRFGRIRSGKVMAYDPATGHRVKRDGRGMVAYAHSLMGITDFRYQGCFFGEHYAASMPGAKILVVESEKTALMLLARLIADGMERHYAVVASSGASNLACDPARLLDDDYRLTFLCNRRVVLIPDADMVDRWEAAGRLLRPYCEKLTTLDVRLPPLSLTASQDIADYLLS